MHEVEVANVLGAEGFVEGKRQLVGNIYGPEKLVATELSTDIGGLLHECASHTLTARVFLDEEIDDVEDSTTEIGIICAAIEQIANDTTLEFCDETGEGGIVAEAVTEVSFRREKLRVRAFTQGLQVDIKLVGQSSD